MTFRKHQNTYLQTFKRVSVSEGYKGYKGYDFVLYPPYPSYPLFFAFYNSICSRILYLLSYTSLININNLRIQGIHRRQKCIPSGYPIPLNYFILICKIKNRLIINQNTLKDVNKHDTTGKA